MGIRKRIKNIVQSKSKSHPPEPTTHHHHRSRSATPTTTRRSSIFNLVSPSDVTEGSLEVWRHLPSKIRQDPSLASFQLENERLHGAIPQDDDFPQLDDPDALLEDNESMEDEFITINVTNEAGEKQQTDEICAHVPKHHHHHAPAKDEVLGDHADKIVEQPTANTIHKPSKVRRYTKMGFLLVVWLFFTAVLTTQKEKKIFSKMIAVPQGSNKYYILPETIDSYKVALSISGPLLHQSYENTTANYLSVILQLVTIRSYEALNESTFTTDESVSEYNESSVTYVIQTLPEEWRLPLPSADKYDKTPTYSRKRVFTIPPVSLTDDTYFLRLQVMTVPSKADLSVKISFDSSPIDMYTGVIYATLILVLLYSLIIWEVIHRTFAAMIVSTVSVAVLAALNDRPTMEEIIAWMDIETLLLLFSMMILVAILTETGIFDYLAVWVFKVTGGIIWPLIHTLCIVTALVSAFLDNVTTILLMTPISIRLCEVMELNPVPVLMAIIVHANIGGTITPIGDPPNIIITSNNYIAKHGVTFLTFFLHMALGVVFVCIQSCIHLRIQHRDIHDLRLKEPKAIKDLRREISVWERAAASLSSYSKDVDLVRETLLKKVKILRHKLKKKELAGTDSTEAYKHTLEELQQNYPIKNKPLLIKSAFVLCFIIGLFLIQSLPALQKLTLGWSALLGVILLLIIADKDDMDALMARVEWTTLLFFAAMFIIMESLTRMGLINWIGKQTENVILSVGEESRLAVAIMMILWISAITSAFVDSIPVTAMMVKVVVSLADNDSLGLPLAPLVWALAFGPCLGGNGTLYGASANVVCAGIAEQHGYKITFINYFKACFPIMIGSIIVTTGYLMVAHVLFNWH